MKIIKKIGSILFCLLPFLLAFGIQLIVTIAGIILRLIFMVLKDPSLIRTMTNPYFIYDLINDSQFLVVLNAVYAIIAALALGFWYWKRFVPKKQPHRKVSSIINFRMFAGLVLLMLGLQHLSIYLVYLVSSINPVWYDTYETLLESIGFGDITLLLAAYSIFIAPISEELIFRGVTMKYAAKTMPFFLANIFQAFLFGLLHGNMIQGTYAFFIGLFCGYICQKGGSIYLSILFHMLFNLWGTFAPEVLSYTGDSILVHLLILATAACVSFAGFFLYRTGVEKRPSV